VQNSNVKHEFVYSVVKYICASIGKAELYEKSKKKQRKGTWGMPRHSEAKKDVASCEKLWGAASKHRSANIRMGQPTPQGVLRKESERRELKHLSTCRRRKQE